MLQEKIQADKIHIGSDSALVITAPDANIRSLDLKKGALVIDGVPGAEIVIDGLVVENQGWEWAALDPDVGASEEEYIRCVEHACR